MLICDIATLGLVIVCTIQGTHKSTYRVNKGKVECLVGDLGYCSISTSDCV